MCHNLPLFARVKKIKKKQLFSFICSSHFQRIFIYMIIIATIILGSIIILLIWRWLQFEPLPFGKETAESRWSTIINGIIHDLPSFIPTWLRVYAIGVVDTISTVIWKRLVKSNNIGQLLHIYKREQQSNRLCILTGTTIV